MNNKELDIDHNMVNSKARQIGSILDGMNVPTVFCIIGTVVIELILNAKEQGYNIEHIVADWLLALIRNIREGNIQLDIPEGQEAS